MAAPHSVQQFRNATNVDACSLGSNPTSPARSACLARGLPRGLPSHVSSSAYALPGLLLVVAPLSVRPWQRGARLRLLC